MGTLVNRSVVFFAAFVAIGATLASAQTIIVRHAPPGSDVDLVVDATAVATAKAGPDGTATVVATDKVTVPLDAAVWVDMCDDAVRVMLVRPGGQLPPAGSCRRAQISALGLYFVQRITTMVIDVRGTPTLLLRQGRAPDAWLRDPVSPDSDDGPGEALPPMTGLTLFGTAGVSTTLNFKSQFCGNASGCSTSTSIPYSGGVAWWLNEFIAADARYNRIADDAEATADAFRFTSAREGGILALTGRAGFRKGRVRPFGRAGMALHRATTTTSQTMTEPAGTQVMQMRTQGWAPVYGGGVEIWLSPVVGIYADGQRIGLKGTDSRGSGIEIDDAILTVQGGITIRFN